MQLDVRCGSLMLVEIGKSMSSFLTVCWVNQACIDVVASPYSESYVG